MSEPKPDEENFEFDAASHKAFLDSIKSRLKEIIKNEPLLDDLEPNITPSELKDILSLEHGESMKLFIRRADDQVFHAIVKLDGTVKDLKDAIQLKYKLKHEKSPTQFPKIINWKYVWKNYGLRFEDEKLIDDSKQMRDYGIKNKSEIKFFRKFHHKHYQQKKNIRIVKN